MNPSLLVELFTEELPPKALQNLGETFGNLVSEELKKNGLLQPNSQTSCYASPRRLAVHITNVKDRAPDQPTEIKLLPVNIGLDTFGQATPPLLKKLNALGLSHIDIKDLTRYNDGKQEQLCYRHLAKGLSLPVALNAALQIAVEKLPIPKLMSYQRDHGNTVYFARPAHNLIALHGQNIVEVSVLGLNANRNTYGHRFLSNGLLSIDNADAYEVILEQQGKVIASFEKRRALICEQLQKAAQQDIVLAPDTLIEEVTALVEWPIVYSGSFAAEFLQVPQECLILTMQTNQKYFALTNPSGVMRNRFLLVSNIETQQPEQIIAGNERVLRARLSDAEFFFKQDCKQPLINRQQQLSQVVYHNQLGTQADRVARLGSLAKHLAKYLQLDPNIAKRAAELAKADLVSEMVGEFPELQGIMGMHYAAIDGETGDIPHAIEEHYHPRFSGDTLPKSTLGICLALADKLETLVGIYSIGLIPTGDRDPFALRRHALGIIRILIEKNLALNIIHLIRHARELFEPFQSVKNNDNAIFEFILDRLRSYLREQGFSNTEIAAVLSKRPYEFNKIIDHLKAVKAFAKLPEANALASANKRISNLLKKSEHQTTEIINHLLVEPAEKALATKLQNLLPKALSHFENNANTEALLLLATIKPEIDEFFNDVMVMVDVKEVRENRLSLLALLHKTMNNIADLAQLATN